MDMNFKKMVELSLDTDIGSIYEQGRINTMEAMQLQMLRIMRGRPFHIELNPASKTSTLGWTDGKTWFPLEPGNYTEGGGPIPPKEGETK